MREYATEINDRFESLVACSSLISNRSQAFLFRADAIRFFVEGVNLE